MSAMGTLRLYVILKQRSQTGQQLTLFGLKIMRIGCFLFLLFLSVRVFSFGFKTVTPENRHGIEIKSELSNSNQLCIVSFSMERNRFSIDRAWLFLTEEKLDGFEPFIGDYLHGKKSAPPELLLITKIRPLAIPNDLNAPDSDTYEVTISPKNAATAYIYIGLPPGIVSPHQTDYSIPLEAFCN